MSAPGAERELALLSAGTIAHRERHCERTRELVREVDWELLEATLVAWRALPQLGPRIIELASARAPERFRADVGRAVELTRRRGALLALVGERIAGALAAAGIPSLALKGPALAQSLYADVGRREAADIDVLVAAEHLRAAVQIARREGYRAPRDHLDADGLPLLHLALAHERAALPPLELHWRVHWYEREFACDMLARSRVGARGLRRARPQDELASLLLFHARDGFTDVRLATDIAAWWDACGASLDDRALRRTAACYPELERALVASLGVVERLGIPARKLLGSRAGAGARARAAMHVANPGGAGGFDQLCADIALVDLLLAPRGALRASFRRQLLPSRALLRARARARGEREASPAGHATRTLVRFAFTLVRLLRRSRETGLSGPALGEHRSRRPRRPRPMSTAAAR